VYFLIVNNEKGNLNAINDEGKFDIFIFK